MTKNLLTLLLFVLTVTGCTQETITTDQANAETMNYDNRDKRAHGPAPLYNPAQWGQGLVIRGAQLQENQEVTILMNDGSGELPQVRTLLLSVIPQNRPAFVNNILRWSIRTGVGGASSVFLFDALGTQQISVPSGKFTIALMAQKYDQNVSFGVPTVDYSVNAYIGNGMTATQRATYTNTETVPATASVNIPIPNGANSFRLMSAAAGDEVDNPLFLVSFTNATVDATFSGDKLIENTAYSDSFIPIPGGSIDLFLVNGSATDAHPIIMWGLDL